MITTTSTPEGPYRSGIKPTIPQRISSPSRTGPSTQRYTGFFVSTQKRMSNNWQMNGSPPFQVLRGVHRDDQLNVGDWDGLRNPNDLITTQVGKASQGD
jgi:hypothetical protein